MLRTEALKEATGRAAADAQTVAAALGVSISSVKSVDIGGRCCPVIYQNYAMSEKAVGGASTPIEAGDITVTATVTVTSFIG